MSRSNLEKFEMRVTIFLLISNILITSVGGYYLVQQYQVKNTEADTALKDIQTKIAAIELENKTSEKILNLLSEKVNISSETIKVIEFIRPKYELAYMADQSKSNKFKHVISYNLTNKGGSSSNIIDYEVFITEKRLEGYPGNQEELLDIKHYKLKVDKYFSGVMHPGSSKPFKIIIDINPGYTNKDKKLFVTLLLKYKTSPPLKSYLMNVSKDLFSEQILKDICNGQTEDITTIEII